MRVWTSLVVDIAMGAQVPTTGEDSGAASRYDNVLLDAKFSDLDIDGTSTG
jgi:hypothetical protein